MHTVDPSAAYVPAGQSEHADSKVAPGMDEAFPAMHQAHEDAPDLSE